MKYSLRSVMIVVLVVPPILAGVYFAAPRLIGLLFPPKPAPLQTWDSAGTPPQVTATDLRYPYPRKFSVDLPASQAPASNPPAKK
jgi:hypothetical protein